MPQVDDDLAADDDKDPKVARIGVRHPGVQLRRLRAASSRLVWHPGLQLGLVQMACTNDRTRNIDAAAQGSQIVCLPAVPAIEGKLRA